ncbi:MAG: hypothetical protein ABIK07_24185 [Planctomycetota bacterium]
MKIYRKGKIYGRVPAELEGLGVFVSQTAGIDVKNLCGETGTKTIFFPASERDFRESSLCVYTESGILSLQPENLGRKPKAELTLRFGFVIFTINVRLFS